MLLLPSTAAVRDLSARASLHPDLSRGIRATIAFMAPLLFALGGWVELEVLAIAIAAQNIAMVDVRGDYRLRFALLLSMVGVFVGAASLGAATAHNLPLAIVATAFLALSGGLWRHLSNDYGPPLAISSTFVFLFALGSPHRAVNLEQHALSAFIGGIWGVLIQVAGWPFRPQHAMRRILADSWIAVADVFAAMTPDSAAGIPRNAVRIQEAETALRSNLDATYAALEGMRPGPLREKLEALNLASARLATRVVALNTALETMMTSADEGSLAATLEPALVGLTNLSRNAALAVVSRQPAHLAIFEVRLRRVISLLRVLRSRVTTAAASDPSHAQLAEIIRQIESHLPAVHQALRATLERATEPVTSSLELLDLRAMALRPLASALNLNLQFDPALIRYTARLALLTILGVVVFKLLDLPHGFWLPFTIVVVLQPDYGSTRERAAQRVLGTVGGILVASGFFWLNLPYGLLMLATAATMFFFGYWIKRNYAVAIFFITLFIVLLTEVEGPFTLSFAVERLASTLAGGALALLASQLFWPVWERKRLPGILASAVNANRTYLRLLISRLATGGGFDVEARTAKRQIETANGAVFSSLRRMSGDPRAEQQGIELAATFANGNNRLTRALNLLSLHLAPTQPIVHEALRKFGTLADDGLGLLAAAIENETTTPGRLEALLTSLEGNLFPPGPTTEHERWVFAQLTRAATEINALLLALQDAAPARTGEAPVPV